MKKTSIHLTACNTAKSERHNKRQVQLDYIRKELSKLNASFNYTGKTLAAEEKRIAGDVKRLTGRKLQKNAIPLKEAVVVIKEDTTMDDLKNFCEKCRAEFGVQPLQIHIHRDEGWAGGKGDEWKPNLHAHIVFSMYNENGQNVRLKRNDCARMQTILAETLDMERGKASGKKHLDAVQYKAAMAEKAVVTSEKTYKSLNEECTNLEDKIKHHKDALSDLKIEILVAGRKVKSFKTMIENLEKEKDSLHSQIAELKEAAAAGKISQEALKKDVEILTEKLNATVDKLGTRQQQLADTEKKLKELQDDLSAVSEKRDAAKNDFDFFSKQSIVAKNSAVEKMGFLAQEIILNRMVNTLVPWYRALPEEAKEGISDTFVEDFLSNANTVSKTAMHLVFGMMEQAMDIAKDSGGGAASPGDGWGRKDDEDEREWIRRCLAEAARMCRPGTVRHRKK